MDTGHTDLTGTSPPPGTMRYLSPELIKGESPTSVSSDVYALGCIGLEFVFSLKPYYWRQDGDSTLLLRDIELGIPAAERRYDLDAYSDHMWALIKDCLDHDSSSRPSASDVLLSIETGPSGMIVESTNEPDNRSLLQPMETMESPGADSDAPGYCVIPGCHKPISQDPTANVPTKYCGRAHMILGQCSSSSVEPAYIPAYTITQATISAVAENPTIHVKSTFTPSLPDELSVEIGDVVSVLEVFNDGWARCKKVDTGNVGFVPQSCLVALPTPRTN
ncbi:hypothetical protein FRC17_005947 [Serendipita sp. 399]|nr:hypothetical protein FRC17_005947 [Serendipita sp. 399]